jgi:molybdopterin-guanine dinucleotide biosynthesis protein A
MLELIRKINEIVPDATSHSRPHREANTPGTIRRDPAMTPSTVIHILAGGSSRRMGTDKSLLKLDGKHLIDWVRLTAVALSSPVNLISKDLQPGKGPLAGIETGLRHSDADFHLFLSCDMPFVSVPTLKDLTINASKLNGIACMQMENRRGFPLVVPHRFLSMVQAELKADRRSLYALFHHEETQVFQWSDADSMEAFNINTPPEFETARGWVAANGIYPPVVSRVMGIIRVSH